VKRGFIFLNLQKLIIMKKKNKILYLIMTGIITGFVNGLFGGGGGMVVVPMLIFLLSYPVKTAHATAILIILPISIISGIIYASYGAFDMNIGLPVTIGVVMGGITGAKLLSKLNSDIVTKIFSIVMFAAGIKMIIG
jgi:hypothetical protein